MQYLWESDSNLHFIDCRDDLEFLQASHFPQETFNQSPVWGLRIF